MRKEFLKFMKKIIVFMLTIICIFGLVACGKKETTPETSSEVADVTTEATTPEPTTEEVIELKEGEHFIYCYNGSKKLDNNMVNIPKVAKEGDKIIIDMSKIETFTGKNMTILVLGDKTSIEWLRMSGTDCYETIDMPDEDISISFIAN